MERKRKDRIHNRKHSVIYGMNRMRGYGWGKEREMGARQTPRERQHNKR